MGNSSTNQTFNSINDVMQDEDFEDVIVDPKTKTEVKVRASSDTPALLAEYAKQISSEPYTVIPPHHGKDIEEVLQTAIVRRFSDVTYDPVPDEVLKNTELDELAKLKKSLETFDASKYAKPARRKVILKSSLINQNGANKTSDSDKTTGSENTDKLNTALVSATSSAQEQLNSKGKKSSSTVDPQASRAPVTECIDADIPLFSPSLFLTTPNLSAKQQQLYSSVNDFLSLNHRLPKADGNEIEQHAAQSLVELRKELPNACRHLIQHFASVLPQADLDVAKAEFLNPSQTVSDQDSTQVSNTEESPQVSNTEASASVSNTELGKESAQNPTQVSNQVAKETSQESTTTTGAQDTAYSETNNAKRSPSSNTALNTAHAESADTAETALSLTDENAESKAESNAELNVDNIDFQNLTEEQKEKLLQEMEDEGLFDDDSEEVYLEPSHRSTPVKHATQSKSVDGKTATYTPCKDFIYYKWMFDSIKQGLRKHKDASGQMVSDLELVPTTGSRQFDIGDAFLSNNSYYLVASMGNSAVAYRTKNNPNGQARIRVITDNRNECDLFDSSFRARFNTYPDTRRVIGKTIKGINLMIDIRDKCISYLKGQPVLGYIYVLRSLSQDPELLEYQRTSELLKIGCTTNTIESRIANAEHETTYLEAPVEVLATYECKILTPEQFEKIIHKVLNMRRCNVKLKSKTTGRVYYPEEWFTVSFEVVKEVIERILDGSIVMYKLNPTNGRLILQS